MNRLGLETLQPTEPCAVQAKLQAPSSIQTCENRSDRPALVFFVDDFAAYSSAKNQDLLTDVSINADKPATRAPSTAGAPYFFRAFVSGPLFSIGPKENIQRPYYAGTVAKGKKGGRKMTSEEYRKRADAVRHLLGIVIDPSERDQLILIASRFDHLARHKERVEGKRRPDALA
jgi:hypothetical protein